MQWKAKEKETVRDAAKNNENKSLVVLFWGPLKVWGSRGSIPSRWAYPQFCHASFINEQRATTDTCL